MSEPRLDRDGEVRYRYRVPLASESRGGTVEVVRFTYSADHPWEHFFPDSPGYGAPFVDQWLVHVLTQDGRWEYSARHDGYDAPDRWKLGGPSTSHHLFERWEDAVAEARRRTTAWRERVRRTLDDAVEAEWKAAGLQDEPPLPRLDADDCLRWRPTPDGGRP